MDPTTRSWALATGSRPGGLTLHPVGRQQGSDAVGC